MNFNLDDGNALKKLILLAFAVVIILLSIEFLCTLPGTLSKKTAGIKSEQPGLQHSDVSPDAGQSAVSNRLAPQEQIAGKEIQDNPNRNTTTTRRQSNNNNISRENSDNSQQFTAKAVQPASVTVAPVQEEPLPEKSVVPATGGNTAVLTIPKKTVVILKPAFDLSIENMSRGDVVELVIAESLVIDGILVAPKGTKARGTVKEANPLKRVYSDFTIRFDYMNTIDQNVTIEIDDTHFVRSQPQKNAVWSPNQTIKAKIKSKKITLRY